jgi:hypothetical protein
MSKKPLVKLWYKPAFSKVNLRFLKPICCSLLAALCAGQLSLAQAQQGTAATNPAKPVVSRITGAAPDASWEEEYAYSLGVTAYVHLFPWLYNALLRWRWATAGVPGMAMSSPVFAPNTLTHQRALLDARYKDGGRPNSDTVYSGGWIDLSREPMLITVPAFGTRYYSIELANFDADNFGYIGTRATGTQAGTYALVGPNWKGTLPKGVTAIETAQTNWVMALVRILIDGPEELPAIHALQDQIVLTPLSAYQGQRADTPAYVPLPPFNRQKDPLADWKSINRALAESPLPAREAQLARMYAQIGIGSGLDVEQMSAPVKQGLARAAKQGAMVVTSAPNYNVGRKTVNGWGMTPANWGRTAPDGSYLVRAAKSLGGFITHDQEENIYPATFVDDKGEALSDARRYVLHFAPGGLPPANAFWSATLYGPDFNFADNPINRYAIGDRSKGLKLDSDGGLTLYIQKQAPGGDKDDNWLPAAGGNFHLVLRMYLPKPAALNGSWHPPAVQAVE